MLKKNKPKTITTTTKKNCVAKIQLIFNVILQPVAQLSFLWPQDAGVPMVMAGLSGSVSDGLIIQSQFVRPNMLYGITFWGPFLYDTSRDPMLPFMLDLSSKPDMEQTRWYGTGTFCLLMSSFQQAQRERILSLYKSVH